MPFSLWNFGFKTCQLRFQIQMFSHVCVSVAIISVDVNINPNFTCGFLQTCVYKRFLDRIPFRRLMIFICRTAALDP